MNNLDELAVLIINQREALLLAWRQQVRQLPSAQHLDTPTLNDHIPGLLEELAQALRSRSEQTIRKALAEGSSPVHGSERFREGYDIEEVVAEYNILRGCIHDLAENNSLSLRGESFHIVNRVLDQAIHDVERLSSQTQTIVLGEIVDAPSQNVVLRNDLFDVISFPETLGAVHRRAALSQCLPDRLLRP